MAFKKKEKPVVLQIFFFKAYFRSKKNPDKIVSRVFKVYATKSTRAKLKVENYCEKNKIKIINVSGVEAQSIRTREYIELGLKKDKKIKIDRIELNRLVKLKHKAFGYVWIADPLLPVTKKIVGDPVAFFVQEGKDHVVVKSIVFDPKYFDLKIEVVEKLINGAQQERKSKINTIRSHMNLLEFLCDRAFDVDLDDINKSIIRQIKAATEQNKKVSLQMGRRIVEQFYDIRKKRVEGGKMKYTVEKALRKAFRKDLENTMEDLEVACKILRKQGFKIMDPQLIF